MSEFTAWKSDLWERWQQQFQRLDSLLNSTPTGTHVYSDSPIFPMNGYSTQNFPAQGRFKRTPPSEIAGKYHYWLDGSRRPTRMAYRHPYNNFAIQGFYFYALFEAEYVEFNVSQREPNCYVLVTIEGDAVRSYRSLRLNGGGTPPAWHHLAPGARVERLKSNSSCYQIHLEEYTIVEGRIGSGHGYIEGMGVEAGEYDLTYWYTTDGRLLRVDSSVGGTRYAARSGRTMSQLCADLSERIASATIERLASLNFDDPLSVVELLYRSVSDYLPSVVPHIQSDGEFPLQWTNEQFHSLERQSFEPDFTELTTRIGRSHHWAAGEKMVRNAARRVNEQIANALPVTDDFCAYAIDWEFEGERAAEVFIDCGVRPDLVRRWQAEGHLWAPRG